MEIKPLYYRRGETLWQVWDAANGGTLFSGSKDECQHFITQHRELQ